MKQNSDIFLWLPRLQTIHLQKLAYSANICNYYAFRKEYEWKVGDWITDGNKNYLITDTDDYPDLYNQELLGAQIDVPIKVRFYDKDGNEIDKDTFTNNIPSTPKQDFDAISGKPKDPKPIATTKFLDFNGNEIKDPDPLKGYTWKMIDENGDEITNSEDETDAWASSLDELFGIKPTHGGYVDSIDVNIPYPKEEEKKEEGSYCPICGSKDIGFAPGLANKCKACEHIW